MCNVPFFSHFIFLPFPPIFLPLWKLFLHFPFFNPPISPISHAFRFAMPGVSLSVNMAGPCVMGRCVTGQVHGYH